MSKSSGTLGAFGHSRRARREQRIAELTAAKRIGVALASIGRPLLAAEAIGAAFSGAFAWLSSRRKERAA